VKVSVIVLVTVGGPALVTPAAPETTREYDAVAMGSHTGEPTVYVGGPYRPPVITVLTFATKGVPATMVQVKYIPRALTLP